MRFFFLLFLLLVLHVSNVFCQTNSDKKISKFFNDRQLKIFLGPGIGPGWSSPDRLVTVNADLSVCFRKNVFTVNAIASTTFFEIEDYIHELQNLNIYYGRFYAKGNIFLSASIGAGYVKEHSTIDPYFFEYKTEHSVGVAANGKALVSLGEKTPLAFGLSANFLYTPETFYYSVLLTLMIRIP